MSTRINDMQLKNIIIYLFIFLQTNHKRLYLFRQLT